MIALTIAATAPLRAQRWMETLGGTNPTGERGDDVTECTNGDIVAVGQSLSVTGTPRAYVVRTDAHGVLLWDFAYDVAGTGNSAGFDIKECADGDLIVAGATGPAASRLAFAMRLTSAGGLIWAGTVRTTLPNNGATAILETTWGDNVTTFAGDIVIGGITLAYTLTAPGMVHLSVTDLLGRTMFENESPRDVGHTTTLVPTTGWGAGTYLVRAVVGGRAVSTRIVVTTR